MPVLERACLGPSRIERRVAKASHPERDLALRVPHLRPRSACCRDAGRLNSSCLPRDQRFIDSTGSVVTQLEDGLDLVYQRECFLHRVRGVDIDLVPLHEAALQGEVPDRIDVI
jgi:hypothetical protein